MTKTVWPIVLLLLAVPVRADELEAALARARARQLDRLHAYAVKGAFPQNLTHPLEQVPIFVDPFGVACAVGHLMRLDRRGGEVAELARVAVNVRVPDVARGPLIDWVLESGLTREECARIQPAYDYRADERHDLSELKDLVLDNIPGFEDGDGANISAVGTRLVVTHTPEVQGQVWRVLSMLRPTGGSASRPLRADRREVHRIRAHLLAVERELRRRTAHSLGVAARRLRIYRRLRAARITCDVRQAPLDDVLALIGAIADVTLVLHPSLRQEVPPERLRITLAVVRLSAEHALGVLQDMLGPVRFVERDGVLLLTHATFGRAYVTRVYDVAPLLYHLRDFKGPRLGLRR